MEETIQEVRLQSDRSTILAIARTRAAYERTMMAWIRTATSLITFGFAIYKFFQLENPSLRARKYLIGPRQFALILVFIGLASLFVATLEYRQNIRALVMEGAGGRRSLAVIVAALIFALGVIAVLLIVFRQ